MNSDIYQLGISYAALTTFPDIVAITDEPISALVPMVEHLAQEETGVNRNSFYSTMKVSSYAAYTSGTITANLRPSLLYALYSSVFQVASTDTGSPYNFEGATTGIANYRRGRTLYFFLREEQRTVKYTGQISKLKIVGNSGELVKVEFEIMAVQREEATVTEAQWSTYTEPNTTFLTEDVRTNTSADYNSNSVNSFEIMLENEGLKMEKKTDRTIRLEGGRMKNSFSMVLTDQDQRGLDRYLNSTQAPSSFSFTMRYPGVDTTSGISFSMNNMYPMTYGANERALGSASKSDYMFVAAPTLVASTFVLGTAGDTMITS